MTKRQIPEHPSLAYIHDPIHIDTIAREFTKFVRVQLDDWESPLNASFAEQKGITNGESWLGVIRGCQIVQAYALKKFTDLGEEPDEPDFDLDFGAAA